MQTMRFVPSMLDEVGIFSALSVPERLSLFARARFERFTRGEKLAHSHDRIELLRIIVVGEVVLSRTAPGGRGPELSTLGVHGVLGGSGLVGPARHDATLVARTAVTTLSLPLLEFELLRKVGDTIALRVLRRLATATSREIRRMSEAYVEGKERLENEPADPRRTATELEPEHERVVSRLAFMEGLDPGKAHILTQKMRAWRAPAGVRVCTEGARGDSCFVVVKGSVEVEALRGSRVHRLALLGPGRMFGEFALVDEGARSATCVTREDSVLLEFRRGEFLSLIAAGGELALAFLLAMNRDLLATAVQMRNQVGRIRPPNLLTTGRLRRAGGDRRSAERLLERVSESVVGADQVGQGPFGARRGADADPSGPGGRLSFVEDFIHREVLPLSSGRGGRSVRGDENPDDAFDGLVADADAIVRDFCRAEDESSLDFVAAGDVMRALIHRLGWHETKPDAPAPRVWIGGLIASDEALLGSSAVKVIGLEEEHPTPRSLEARFTSGQDGAPAFCVLPLCSADGRALDHRECQLAADRCGVTMIWVGGDRSAHVPGAGLSDELGLALWGWTHLLLRADVFSGGSGAADVLLIRAEVEDPSPRSALGWRVPQRVHLAAPSPATRLMAVRAGLAIHLHQELGPSLIREREQALVRRATQRWRGCPGLELQGGEGECERAGLAAISFADSNRARPGAGDAAFVHSLLLDLFGICTELVLNPRVGEDGLLRIGFRHHLREPIFNYIVGAIELVAREGHRLFDQYVWDAGRERYVHQAPVEARRLHLQELRYVEGSLDYPSGRIDEPESALQRQLEGAVERFAKAGVAATSLHEPPDSQSGEVRRVHRIAARRAGGLDETAQDFTARTGAGPNTGSASGQEPSRDGRPRSVPTVKLED